MKTPSVIVALASTAASVAFQLGLANGHFRSYDWITPYLWGASGAFWLVFAILALKGSQASTHVAVPDSSPVQQQTANPIMNQAVHVHVPDQIRPQDHQPRATPAVGRAEPQPNIRCIEACSIKVHASGQTLIVSPQGLGDFDVAVAWFRNEPVPGERVEQPNLRAHIIYRGERRQEITDVQSGVWLGEYGEYTTFTAGTRRGLILFLLTNQGTLKKLWKESYTHQNSWMSGGPSYRIRDEVVREPIAAIDISLLRSNGQCVMQATLDLAPDEEGRLPNLVIRGI